MPPATPSPETTQASLKEKLATATIGLRDEYLEGRQAFPWIVGFSGGKDSTLLLQLVIEMLLSLAPEDRKRPVHVLTNDTLVESPVLARHIDNSLDLIRAAGPRLALPLTVVKTTPAVDQTFWVNLIGRGYPSPNRMFRWCSEPSSSPPRSGATRSPKRS